MKNSNVHVVKRSDVEDLARLIRKFAKSGDKDFLELKHIRSKELSKQAFDGDTVRMWGFEYLFSALCGISNLCDASDDLIIQVLELIGIHVEDDEEKVEDDGEEVEQ